MDEISLLSEKSTNSKLSSFTIIDFPDEILLRIFHCNDLTIEDILNISLINKRFNLIASTDNIWKYKFCRRWLWNWNQIQKRGYQIDNWKKESLFILHLYKELDRILNQFSKHLFDKDYYQTLIVNSALDIFSKSRNGFIYGYDRLLSISSESLHPILSGCPAQRPQARPNWHRVLPNSEFQMRLAKLENMTVQYYARSLLTVVRNIICSADLEEFLHRPLTNQPLLEAFVTFEMWENKLISLNLNDVEKHIKAITINCKNHLASNWAQHPALKFSFQPLNQPLVQTLWNYEDSNRLLRSIDHCLYTQHGFRGERSRHPINRILYISHVLERKSGLPITLCVIYLTVCHYLGIKTEVYNLPGHFMLKWNHPESNSVEYIDAYNGGRRLSDKDLDAMVRQEHRKENQCDLHQEHLVSTVLRRVANNLLVLNRSYGHEFQSQWFIFERIAILAKYDSENTRDLDLSNYIEFKIMLFKMYMELGLYLDRILHESTSWLDKGQLSEEKREELIQIRSTAEDLLKQERTNEALNWPERPAPQTRPTARDVKFAIGMIMRHALYKYECVITGWDMSCQMSQQWIIQMGVMSLKHTVHQPFYHVLAEDGSQRYAAEENLFPSSDPEYVPHKEIGRYFDQFDGRYYIPNEQLAALYPHDEAHRHNFKNAS